MIDYRDVAPAVEEILEAYGLGDTPADYGELGRKFVKILGRKKTKVRIDDAEKKSEGIIVDYCRKAAKPYQKEDKIAALGIITTDERTAASKTIAMYCLKTGARGGDLYSTYDLASVYYEGKIVAKDIGWAEYWARKAASFPLGERLLGEILLENEDYENAIGLLEKTIDSSNPEELEMLEVARDKKEKGIRTKNETHKQEGLVRRNKYLVKSVILAAAGSVFWGILMLVFW